MYMCMTVCYVLLFQALTKNIEDKYTKLLAEIDGLAELRQQSDSVTAERNSLSSNNKVC